MKANFRKQQSGRAWRGARSVPRGVKFARIGRAGHLRSCRSSNREEGRSGNCSGRGPAQADPVGFASAALRRRCVSGWHDLHCQSAQREVGIVVSQGLIACMAWQSSSSACSTCCRAPGGHRFVIADQRSPFRQFRMAAAVTAQAASGVLQGVGPSSRADPTGVAGPCRAAVQQRALRLGRQAGQQQGQPLTRSSEGAMVCQKDPFAPQLPA